MDVLGLAALAAAFAAINGSNDGGTLVANGLKITSIKPLTAILLVVGGLVLVPLAFGTEVATTLVNRLVDLSGPAGQRTLAVAILAATGVTMTLARRGLPTSLTLALIGGITGAGFGAGMPVEWSVVGLVLLLAALAPFVGALLAFAISSLPIRLPAYGNANRVLGLAHRGGFSLQCFAYGANDGQKVLAVFAIASGQDGIVRPTLPILLATGGFFAIGLLLGLRKVAATISGGVLATRPYDAVVAEFASAGSVISSAALGVPVSMTQTITGGLVGAGAKRGMRRIRWQVVARIGTAWALTLPAAVLSAALGGFVMHTAIDLVR